MAENERKDPRERAVRRAAKDALGMELGMEHKDSEHSITTADLRRALELAYDLGRKSGLS